MLDITQKDFITTPKWFRTIKIIVKVNSSNIYLHNNLNYGWQNENSVRRELNFVPKRKYLQSQTDWK